MQRYDRFLPYTASEFEQFGHDVMHYTLGAMGNDELQVDLPGVEWAWNLERLLDSVDQTVLKRSEVIRLNKVLAWLRGASWT